MILHIGNPSLLPPLRSLIDDAFAAGPVDGETAMRELSQLITSPACILLVGHENREFRALCVLSMPGSRLCAYPAVYHYYNGGSQTLGNALSDKLVECVKARGYTGLYAINATGRADNTWCRAFRRVGNPVPLGTAFLFEF